MKTSVNKGLKCIVLIIIISACYIQQGLAQSKRSSSVRDSLRRSIMKRDSIMRTFKKSDTSINSLLQKLEYYNASFNQIKNNLSHGIDTTEISKNLPAFEKRIGSIKNMIDNDQSSTLRYLYAIRDFLAHSDDQLDSWQEQVICC